MADNVELQGLEIQIIGDSVSAEDSLNKLKDTLTDLKTAVKGGVSGVRTTSRQIAALKEALNGFDNEKTRALRDIADGLTALGAIGDVKISSTVATQITALNTALRGLDTSSTNKLADLAVALKPLSEIGRAHLTSLINQLGKLPDLIRELDKVDLDKFTRQMSDLAGAMKPFADEMDKVASGFVAFPSRIQRLITSTEKYNGTVKKATGHTNLWSKAMKALSWGSILVGLRKVAQMIAQCINRSNEYQESLNLFTVALGEYAEEAQDYATKVSEAMGIDPAQWLKTQGVFNTLLTGFGNVADRAYTMSTNLTQLGYDLASFFNISVEDAMQKLQSGISGELEPLRRLGYDLSQVRLESVALSLGIDKLVSKMNQAEKAELRYYAIMTQVTTAQGDMARTLQAPANQLRILKAQLEMCARFIGNIFIPALNAILPYAIAAVQVIREIADAVAELFGFEITEVDYSGVNNLASGAEDSKNAMEEVNDTIDDTNKALKKMKQYTLGFDELNIIPQNADTSAADDLADALGDISDGAGFDFELPTYGFLGDAINTRVNEIKAKMQPFVTWVRDHLDIILDVVKSIGTAILAWKITQGFLSGVGIIKDTWSTMKDLGKGIGTVVEGVRDYYNTVKELAPQVGTFQAMFPKTSAWLAGLSQSLANAKAAIAGFFASIPTAAIAGFAGILVGVPTFITSLYKALTEGLDWINAALIAAGATATGAGVGAIIGSLGGPIGTGIGALIGLTVGLITDFGVWLYQNWDEVGEYFRNLWTTVSDFFSQLWGDIRGVWSNVTEWFNTNVLSPVTNVFKTLTDWIGTFFEGCWIIVQAVWIVASEWFKVKVIEPIQKWFNKMTMKIREVFSEAWQKIKGTWASAKEWFNTTIIQPVQDKFNELTTKVSQFFSEAWVEVKDVWASVKDWFKSTVIDPVVQHFKTAVENIKNAFRNAFIWIRDFIKGIFNGVIGNIEGVINRVIEGFNKLIGKFNNVVEWAADIVGTDWKGLKTISLVSLPRLADGGFVDEGQLFIAREAGAEMVGSMNNRTAVANNDQIVEGIKRGVYEAMIASGDNRNIEVNLYLDGDQMMATIARAAKRETIRTGRNPLLVGG